MSPSSPRVSIGLPVYNGETYLGLAIDSILAQTFTDFELVICDNCSTDRTQEICEHYAKQDARVRYYRNPENLGAGPNYDRTFELSSGEYFKWMAHDDLIAPEFLEKCVAALDADPGAVLCHARVELMDADGEVTASYDPGLNDTISNRVSDRFSAVIIPVHMGTDFFGVIRRTALEGSPLHGKYPGS
ncbi:MAG: glycosyltransferase family 2 protein, partial [Rhodospirillales bacterium]|nr:glycosyltransferase family 2 protein [Rhodospirillales bacterium]